MYDALPEGPIDARVSLRGRCGRPGDGDGWKERNGREAQEGGRGHIAHTLVHRRPKHAPTWSISGWCQESRLRDCAVTVTSPLIAHKGAEGRSSGALEPSLLEGHFCFPWRIPPIIVSFHPCFIELASVQRAQRWDHVESTSPSTFSHHAHEELCIR